MRCDHRDLNALILDYLTTEGYPSAAAKFSSEANLQLPLDMGIVKSRNTIQHDIHNGDIQTAIDAINELNPQVSTYISLAPPSSHCND